MNRIFAALRLEFAIAAREASTAAVSAVAAPIVAGILMLAAVGFGAAGGFMHLSVIWGPANAALAIAGGFLLLALIVLARHASRRRRAAMAAAAAAAASPTPGVAPRGDMLALLSTTFLEAAMVGRTARGRRGGGRGNGGGRRRGGPGRRRG